LESALDFLSTSSDTVPNLPWPQANFCVFFVVHCLHCQGLFKFSEAALNERFELFEPRTMASHNTTPTNSYFSVGRISGPFPVLFDAHPLCEPVKVSILTYRITVSLLSLSGGMQCMNIDQRKRIFSFPCAHASVFHVKDAFVLDLVSSNISRDMPMRYDARLLL